jgi:hypothetical protein
MVADNVEGRPMSPRSVPWTTVNVDGSGDVTAVTLSLSPAANAVTPIPNSKNSDIVSTSTKLEKRLAMVPPNA